MSELIGITGKIGSGKSTFAKFLADTVESNAIYETSDVIIEVANRFNQLLEAELNFAVTEDKIELINQTLIWMPDIVSQDLHHDISWTQIAIHPKDVRTHPEQYGKLISYLDHVYANRKLVETTITSVNKADYRGLLQWLGSYFVTKISKTIWYDELLRRIALRDAQTSLVIVVGVRYKSDAACLIERGGRIIKITRRNDGRETKDATEAEQSLIDPDVTIYNNGTPEQLQNIAEVLWNDLAANKLKRNYSAS